MPLDPRVHSLLSQWESADSKPSAEQLCIDCPELIPEVRRYIDQLRSVEHKLSPCELPRPQVPGYEVLQLIGEGGMGSVWRAVQLGTRQPVALKVLAGWRVASPKWRDRFIDEVTLSSRLQHPHIARVYDGNILPGEAFYAMELVDGPPLDRHVADRNLPLRDILVLMQKIARAVHHAHQRAIIHRDLKPSNILVDRHGEPRVLDFGLAKDLDGQGSHLTMDNVVPGTPAYMSPEQADGRSKDVDTRSDVYSLGVILYELLLKQSPYGQDIESSDLRRRVARGDLLPPRQVDPSLDRDLEAILIKATEHAPRNRYDTAEALAADIENHLAGRPITARRRTTGYVVGKWLRRHWAATAATAAVLMLLGGTILWAFVNVASERDRAENELQIRKAVDTFLLERLLTAPDPAHAKGPPPTVLELLDRASEEVGPTFEAQPLTEAAVRLVLGRTYINLTDSRRAGPHLRRASEICHRDLGPDAPQTLETDAVLAFWLESLGFPEAERLQRSVGERCRRLLGEEHPDTLMSDHRLANIFIERGRHQEAVDLLRRTLDSRRRVLSDRHRDTIWSMSDLGATLARTGQNDEAEALLREALRLRLSVHGPDDIDTLNAELNLGSLLRRQQRFDESEAMLRANVASRRRVYGATHGAVSVPLHSLALQYKVQQRWPEAEAAAREAFEFRLSGNGYDLGTMRSFQLLAEILAAHNRQGELAGLLAESAAHAPDALQNLDVRWMVSFISILQLMPQPEEAQDWSRRLLAAAESRLPPGDPMRELARQTASPVAPPADD